jgi:hypothetical protein
MINLADVPKEGGKPLVDLDALDRALETPGPDEDDDVAPGELSKVADLPEPAAPKAARKEPPPRMSTAMAELMEPKRRWGWIIAVLVLLAAAAVAAAIGLSGPSVSPAKPGSSAPAPP